MQFVSYFVVSLSVKASMSNPRHCRPCRRERTVGFEGTSRRYAGKAIEAL